MKYLDIKEYDPPEEYIFYCELRDGTWESKQGIYSTSKSENYLTVYWGETPELCISYKRCDLVFWSVLHTSECYVYDGKVFPFPK